MLCIYTYIQRNASMCVCSIMQVIQKSGKWHATSVTGPDGQPVQGFSQKNSGRFLPSWKWLRIACVISFLFLLAVIYVFFRCSYSYSVCLVVVCCFTVKSSSFDAFQSPSANAMTEKHMQPMNVSDSSCSIDILYTL